MRDFFQRLSVRFRQFMAGRYGNDQLNRFLLVVAFILILINMFVRTGILSILVWAVIILAYLRMFSRNIQRRYNENTRYLQLKERVLGFFSGQRGGQRSYTNSQRSYSSYDTGTASKRGTYRSDAEHRIFRCPNCDQRVRVPRGRGKIEITCPKCGHRFTKRS